MYDFLNIKLDRKNGKYAVENHGSKITYAAEEHQERNPVLAVNKFASEFAGEIKLRLRKYLIENELNPVMGCKITGMSCKDCKACKLNTAESNCIFGGIADG